MRKHKIRHIVSVRSIGLVVLVCMVLGAVVVIGTHNKGDSSAASGGWSSGEACCESPEGFGAWRGSPSTLIGVYGDADDSNQRNIPMFNGFGSWTKDMDVAPGMIVSGESLSAAANGAYEDRWRTAMDSLRNNWGSKRTVYIRPAHEMNGDWYPWSVNSGNAEDFKKAWIRYYNIIQQELVQKGYDAKVTFCLNKDPVNGMSPDSFWPGDQYVDVVGVDFYDMYPSYPTQADWDGHYNDTKAGGPYGIGAYQAFAKAHGKPLAFPEWGTNPHETSDNPFYIQKMNEFFRANAGTGPGQVIYESYFNLWPNLVQLYPTTSVPNSAAMYKSLSWGNGGAPADPGGGTGGGGGDTGGGDTGTGQSGSVSQTNNLAAGKTFISSVPDSSDEPGNPVGNVNDQNESTRWISEPQDNTTLSTDLGASYTLSKVSILWAGDTVKNYDLQVSSDNANWTTIASGTTNNTQKQLIDTTSFTTAPTGRYFRILMKDRWNSSYGNSIWEIGLYGTAAATTATPGDANNDNHVNGLDYSILAEHDGTNYAAADFNKDGTVGAADLSILLSHWTW